MYDCYVVEMKYCELQYDLDWIRRTQWRGIDCDYMMQW